MTTGGRARTSGDDDGGGQNQHSEQARTGAATPDSVVAGDSRGAGWATGAPPPSFFYFIFATNYCNPTRPHPIVHPNEQAEPNRTGQDNLNPQDAHEHAPNGHEWVRQPQAVREWAQTGAGVR